MGNRKIKLTFLLVILLSLPFFSVYQFFSITDSMDMLNMSISIYELHDLSIAVRVNTLTGEAARLYSKYGLGLPFLMVPFLFAYDVLSSFVTIPPAYVLGAVNIIVIALTAAALHALIVQLGFSWKRAIFLSIAAVFGTFAYAYINNFLSEPLQGLFLCCALLFIISQRRLRLYAFLAGLAIGAVVFTKAANLVFLPIFSAYLIYRCVREKDTFGRLASFFAPLIVIGIIMMWLNMSRFGSPFDFGYGAEAGMFVNPIHSGIKNLLVNPSKGLLIYAPVTLLFPYALLKLARTKRPEAILIAALFIVNLTLYSAWWAWEGADTWGPRFLLPLVPAAVAPLAAIMDRTLSKALIAALFVAGFMATFIAVFVDASAYNYIVLKSTAGLELDTVRPKRDYLAYEGRLQVPPYVVTSEVPEFNVLSGHFWLLLGRVSGEGLSTPPWLEKYPAQKPPAIDDLPEEIRIRIKCAPPRLFSYFTCPDKAPSSPYYYDAYHLQAAKAEALGNNEAAEKLKTKAQRGLPEKRLRLIQMGY